MLQTPRGIKRGQDKGDNVPLKRTKLDFAANLPTIDTSLIITEHSYYMTQLPNAYLNLLTAILSEEKEVARPESWFCSRDYANQSVTYFNCFRTNGKLVIAKQVIIMIKVFNFTNLLKTQFSIFPINFININ